MGNKTSALWERLSHFACGVILINNIYIGGRKQFYLENTRNRKLLHFLVKVSSEEQFSLTVSAKFNF